MGSPECVYHESQETMDMTKGALNSDLSLMDRPGVRMLENAYRNCEIRFGRPATNIEVCEELGITLQDLYAQLEQCRGLKLGQFEEIEVQAAGGADVQIRYAPFAPDEEDCHVCAQADFRSSLSLAVNALPKNEQLVLFLRYRQKLSVTEIAARLGFSEARVAQIHTMAMLRIRPKLLEVRGREPQTALLSTETAPAA